MLDGAARGARSLRPAGCGPDELRGRRPHPAPATSPPKWCARWKTRGAAVIGANCSTGPVRMAHVLAEMAARGPRAAQRPAQRRLARSGRRAHRLCVRPGLHGRVRRSAWPTWARGSWAAAAAPRPSISSELAALHPPPPRRPRPPSRATPADGDGADHERPRPDPARTPARYLCRPHHPAHGARSSRGPPARSRCPAPLPGSWAASSSATVELAPPRGINPAKLLAGARMLQRARRQRVDITDSAARAAPR